MSPPGCTTVAPFELHKGRIKVKESNLVSTTGSNQFSCNFEIG